MVAGAGVLILVATAMGSVPTALSGTEQPRWEVDQNLNAGVGDARGSSAAGGMTLRNWVNNLSLAYVNPDIAPLGDGSGLARSLREIDKAAANWPERPAGFTNPSEVGVFCGFLGNLGIATGPITHLIDDCALTDRYLAGRPFVPAEPFAWKPGHFHRAVPEGYVDAVATGDPARVVDPLDRYDLEELWKRKQSDVLRFLLRVRCWEYRQLPGIVRLTRPSRPDKARRMGFKAKQGYVVYRVRVRRGGRKKPVHKVQPRSGGSNAPPGGWVLVGGSTARGAAAALGQLLAAAAGTDQCTSRTGQAV